MATAFDENAPRALVLTQRQLNALITELSAGIAPALAVEAPRNLFLQPLQTPGATRSREFGLLEGPSVGGRSLFATDDRGTEKDVVSLATRPERSQHLLLALTLSWNADAQNAIRFIRSQVIVFLAWGAARVADTPRANRRQLLRLEWEGLDRQGRHEARSAAHPHWQIDRWLAGYDVAQAIAAEAIRRADTPQDFSGSGQNDPPTDVHWIRAVHLAAAARWATTLWAGNEDDFSPHASGPLDAEQLKNWTFSSLRYLRLQFLSAFERL